MTYAVIEKDGARQNVLEASLAGYEGWTVVARGLPAVPEFCSGISGGKWTVDQAAKAAAERRAAALQVSREDLVTRIEAIEARLGLGGADAP